MTEINEIDMDNKDYIDFISKQKRYEDFTLLSDPKPFSEMFKGRNFRWVQVNHITKMPSGEFEDLGFSGAFSWLDGILIPLDGSTYNKNIPIRGYKTVKDHLGIEVNVSGLNIIVDEAW